MDYGTVTIVTERVRDTPLAAPGSLIKTCLSCQADVWFDAMAVPPGSQVTEFICRPCFTNRYADDPTLGLPELSDAGRQRLQELGYTNVRIDRALFRLALETVGKVRRGD